MGINSTYSIISPNLMINKIVKKKGLSIPKVRHSTEIRSAAFLKLKACQGGIHGHTLKII